MNKLSGRNLVSFGKYVMTQCISVVTGMLFVLLLSAMWLKNNGQLIVYETRSMMVDGVVQELHCIAYSMEKGVAHVKVNILLALPHSLPHLTSMKDVDNRRNVTTKALS